MVKNANTHTHTPSLRKGGALRADILWAFRHEHEDSWPHLLPCDGQWEGDEG